MCPEDDGFRLALDADVGYIVARGFSAAIEPRRVPALAEMAKALTHQQFKPYGEAVEEVLGWAINRAAHPLLLSLRRAKNRKDIIRGLELLFGLPEGSSSGIEDRMNTAGPFLGYPKGYDQFRHARHNKRFVRDIIQAEVTSQLVVLGEEAEFSYAGTLVVTPPTKQLDRPRVQPLSRIIHRPVDIQPPSPRKPLDASGYARVFYQEIERLYARGLTYAEAYAPNLAQLAHRALDTDGIENSSSVGELRAFLVWLMDQVEDPDFKQATLELFGLSAEPGDTWIQRLDLAAPHLGYATGEAIPNSDPEKAILFGLTRKLTEIAMALDLDDS